MLPNGPYPTPPGFEIAQTAIFAIFALIVVIVVVRLAIAAMKSLDNAASPRLTLPARVVSKRDEVYSTGVERRFVRTSYFATFEFEDGRRIELEIPQNKIGYLAEGDVGSLTLQGTWFRGFRRMP